MTNFNRNKKKLSFYKRFYYFKVSFNSFQQLLRANLSVFLFCLINFKQDSTFKYIVKLHVNKIFKITGFMKDLSKINSSKCFKFKFIKIFSRTSWCNFAQCVTTFFWKLRLKTMTSHFFNLHWCVKPSRKKISIFQ